MRVDDIPGFKDLTVEEKMDLLDDMWKSIASRPEMVPMPESHKAELDLRLERYEADLSRALSFDELQSRINRQR